MFPLFQRCKNIVSNFEIVARTLQSVILFCIFYSQIQAASQSKKGLYFTDFGDFFSKPGDLLGFIPKF